MSVFCVGLIPVTVIPPVLIPWGPDRKVAAVYYRYITGSKSRPLSVQVPANHVPP